MQMKREREQIPKHKHQRRQTGKGGLREGALVQGQLGSPAASRWVRRTRSSLPSTRPPWLVGTPLARSPPPPPLPCLFRKSPLLELTSQVVRGSSTICLPKYRGWALCFAFPVYSPTMQTIVGI